MSAYFNPKVISAAISVLVVALVSAAVDFLGVDFLTGEMIWGFVIGGSVATVAAYAKGDGRTYGRRDPEAGTMDPLYLLVVALVAVLLVWAVVRLVGS